MLRNVVLASVFAALVAGFSSKAWSADAALAQKWVAYGNQVMAAKDYDKAIQAFSTAARADSRSAAAWKGLGTAYYYKQDYSNAAKYYKYAYQLNPADSQLAAFIPKLEAAAANSGATSSPADMAARLYQARRYDEAIQYYNTALAANPNDAKSWQGIGNCYYAKQDKPKAVEAYQRALQLNPSNTALQNFLAKYAPGTPGAGSGALADGPKDWVQPLWRSAVLPGWGQGYNGQAGKGWLLGGTTLAMLGGTVATYIIGDAARVQYNSLTAPDADYDGPYNTWDQMASLNHVFYIAFGVGYTFTLVDAVMSAKRLPRTTAEFQEEAPALQAGLLNSNGSYGVKYRVLQF